MVYPISLDHFLSLRCSLFRIHLIYEHLYFLRLLAADILPGEQAGHEGRQAAGDLFGIELFQQRAVRDVGGDDGGQVRRKKLELNSVPRSSRMSRSAPAAVCSKVSSSPPGSAPKCSASSLEKKSGLDT